MSKPTKPRLTIEQLRAERCFIDLTPKQQLMIETFIASNGDKLLAVKTAYAAKNSEVARVMTYEYFANPKVIACLAAYFQDDPLDIFKEEVRRAFRNQKLTLAQMQAMQMYCDLSGWGSASLPRLNGYEPQAASKTKAPQVPAHEVSTARESAPPSSIPIFPPKYKVGTIANDPEDGKPYILLAVSADGNEVTEARLLVKSADGTFFDSIAKGASPTDNRVPAGATPLADKFGVVRGYRTAENQYVQLADIEVR